MSDLLNGGVGSAKHASTLKSVALLLFVSILGIECLATEIVKSVNVSSTDTNVVALTKKGYSVGYSKKYKQALWCLYVLKSSDLLNTNKVKRTNDFRGDTNLLLNASVVVNPEAYSHTGFDMGHLCPAQDRAYLAELMSETFLMSNMSPQEPAFNRGIWKQLENYTRDFAVLHTNIVVITGPIILNRYQTLKDTNVAIPQMYYKILVPYNKEEMECYILPNQKCENNWIEDFQVPLDCVKAFTGLDIEVITE